MTLAEHLARLTIADAITEADRRTRYVTAHRHAGHVTHDATRDAIATNARDALTLAAYAYALATRTDRAMTARAVTAVRAARDATRHATEHLGVTVPPADRHASHAAMRAREAATM